MAADPLRTPLCARLGIDVPILLAGMGGFSLSDLAAAVSEAGGLGFLGGIGLSMDRLRSEIKRTRNRTSKPFGVDLFVPKPMDEDQARQFATLIEQMPPGDRGGVEAFLRPRDMIEMVLSSGVPFFASALGNPGWMVPSAHEAGVTVLALVGTVRQAVACAKAGVDVLVAQGYDAGGHTGRIGTFSLIPQVVDAVDVPVVAAGGIADGRGVAAALALGAQGAWLGSRFVATREAHAVEAYKKRLLEIGDDDTTLTRAYTGRHARMIKNKYTAMWEGRESEIAPFPLQMARTSKELADKDPDDVDWIHMPAGQASGLIRDMPSAGEVLERIADEARHVLRRLASGR
jgi:enoyl-[acyl-carrier protein] reductase II